MLPHFKMYMNQTRTCLHISAIPQTICTNLEHWLPAIYVADRFKNACVNKTVQFFPLPGTEAVCAQNHEMFVKALVGKMWSSISRSEIGRWWLKKKKKKKKSPWSRSSSWRHFSYDSFRHHSIQCTYLCIPTHPSATAGMNVHILKYFS